MLTLRVHDATPRFTGRVRYLTLDFHGQRSLTMNLCSLESETNHQVPPLCLSKEAVYDLLQGQDIVVERTEGNVTLRAIKDILHIDCDSHGPRIQKNYRVWLAEMNLGFNLLRGNA